MLSNLKVLCVCILFHGNGIFIYAKPKYPADISYLVTDFKYSQKHGLKICEVQQGALSAVDGDLYVSGGDGSISPMVARLFSLSPTKKWAMGVLYPPLERSLKVEGWNFKQSMNALLKDPDFLDSARSAPIDSSSISSYGGIVYSDFDVFRNFTSYSKSYPGILFIDAATFPYWRDKYKMSALFNMSDELKQYKADWRLYPKKYDLFLSERIQEEMPADFYVIKPRSEVLANGVIVVASDDLDRVLQLILDPLERLGKHPDKKYAYWWKNRDDTFLIEKYYMSDYLCFPQSLSQSTPIGSEYHYDATMRVAFILVYDGGEINYHSLGGFWKLPSKALEEEGTLNEKRISCCKPPFYRAVDPKLLKQVDREMERAMLLLYEMMLNGSLD